MACKVCGPLPFCLTKESLFGTMEHVYKTG